MDREIPTRVRRRRLWIRVAVALAAAGGGWGLLLALGEWLHPSVRSEAIRTAVVDRGPVEEAIEASGVVVPAFERVVASPIDSRVERLLRRPGDTLRPGEPILELDTSGIRLEVERLADRLAQKASERERARLELDDTLDDLRAAIATQELDLEILRHREEQQRRLHADGLVAESALREAEVSVRKGLIALDHARERLDNARRSGEARLGALDLELGFVRKEHAQESRELELATMGASDAGVLTWVVPREGAAVARGEVLARLADLSAFRVDATVSDVHARRIAAGLPVRVLVGEAVLTGRVATVHPTIEGGTLRFEVALDEPDDRRLRNQLRVDVLVVTGRRENVLRLARGSFGRGGAASEVFVVRGDTAHRTRVRFGVSGHEWFEVTDGLVEGDEAIVSDMQSYAHLEEVRIR